MKKKTMYGWDKETYPTDEKGNYIIPLSDIGKTIKFHDLVKENSNYYGSPEYIALKHDIEVNGFDNKYPILIWKNKIVDGWHRVTSSKELENESIVATVLPYNTTLADVKIEVLRTEKGRQMTKSQLAIKGWRNWKDGTYKSVAQAALNIGVSGGSIKAVSYVASHGDTDWINEIYNGKEVRFGDGIKTSDNIFTIKSFLEKVKHEEGKNNNDKQFKVLTDPEMELLKKNLENTLKGVLPGNILNIANFVYKLSKEK